MSRHAGRAGRKTGGGGSDARTEDWSRGGEGEAMNEGMQRQQEEDKSLLAHI